MCTLLALGDSKPVPRDGLGRLVRTQSPYPNADFPNHGVRSEHFYYDGIRRIQELVVDPLFSLDDSEESNNSEVENAANQAQLGSPHLLDGSAAPMGYEQAQENELNIQVYLEREYLWGPGDRGVDELLVQFDHTAGRNPWWVIQDDGGDVVAVCDSGGSGGKGRVVQQLTYDAYGEALTSTSLHPHPVLRCGHKALFVDRLDIGVMSSSFIEHERIVPFSHTLCYNRNRTYSPQSGRFLQPDPNETGMSLLAATGFGGRGAAALSIAFGLEGHYGDGLNVYEYLGSNPWNRSDPMGLSWDPFSMVDEYLAEDAGSKAAFLERIIGGAATAAYVGAAILSNMPFPLAMAAGTVGMMALEGEVPPEAKTLAKVLGFASLGALVGKIALHAAVTAVKYVMTHGLRGTVRNLWNGARSLAGRAWNWAQRKIFKTVQACGCFAAGTTVWTMTGLVPIEQIKIGDYVVARDDRTSLIQFAPVEATIETPGAALLNVAVRHADGTTEVLETTDEHPFWVETKAIEGAAPTLRTGVWRRADELAPGNRVSTLMGYAVVLGVTFTSERQIVFNLTVQDVGTFHVGSDGILVHNCHRHHLIPAFRNNADRQAYFLRRNIDPDDFALDFPVELHRQIHPRWNHEWERFMDANPNASGEEIFTKMHDMWKQFELPPGDIVRYHRGTR